jgi:hypothetical protein
VGPTVQSHGAVVHGATLSVVTGLHHPLVCVGIYPSMVYLLRSFGHVDHRRDSGVEPPTTEVD